MRNLQFWCVSQWVTIISARDASASENKKVHLKVWLRVRLEYWDWFQYWPPCHSILKSWKPCLVNRKRYQSLARSRISSFICSFIVYLPIHSFLQHKNISIIRDPLKKNYGIIWEFFPSGAQWLLSKICIVFGNNFQRIRIRILFGLRKSPEYEYE